MCQIGDRDVDVEAVMNRDDAQEIAQFMTNCLTTEPREIVEPVLITIVALELHRNARDVLEEPFSLEQAVSMATRFIRD